MDNVFIFLNPLKREVNNTGSSTDPQIKRVVYFVAVRIQEWLCLCSTRRTTCIMGTDGKLFVQLSLVIRNQIAYRPWTNTPKSG
jgi:hypothetical protein